LRASRELPSLPGSGSRDGCGSSLGRRLPAGAGGGGSRHGGAIAAAGGADEIAPALALDDEFHAEEACGLNTLQRALAAREVAAERSHFGTCQGYGCGAG